MRGKTYPPMNLAQATPWGREIQKDTAQHTADITSIRSSIDNVNRRIDSLPLPETEFTTEAISGWNASLWDIQSQHFTRNGEWVSGYFSALRLGGTFSFDTGADFSTMGALVSGWRPLGPVTTLSISTLPPGGSLLLRYEANGTIVGVRTNPASVGSLDTNGSLIVHCHYRAAIDHSTSAEA